MYSVSVPARLRQQLSQFLERLPQVVRVVQPRSTLLRDQLYVECRDRHVLVKALWGWPKAHQTSRAQRFPVLLGLADRQAAVPSSVVPSSRTLTGVWARITGPDNLYQNDLLAMIAGHDPLYDECAPGDRLALVVPRIEFEAHITHPADHRPPAGLFIVQQVDDKFPDDKPMWVVPLQLWIWGKSAFRDSGLSVVKMPPSFKLLTSGVLPTDEELALFASSLDYSLDRPSLESWVLQPGDRVIVIEAKQGEFTDFTKLAGDTGYIMAMDANTAFATVLLDHVHSQRTEDEGQMAAATKREEHPLPLSLLRLHLLATVPMLSIGDRVGILRGPHFGSYGRIVEFSGAYVDVLPLEGDLMSVETRDVRIDLRLGDVVEVTRGTYQGSVGFIVALCVRGYVELCIVSGFFLFVDSYLTAGSLELSAVAPNQCFQTLWFRS